MQSGGQYCLFDKRRSYQLLTSQERRYINAVCTNLWGFLNLPFISATTARELKAIQDQTAYTPKDIEIPNFFDEVNGVWD